MGQAQAARRASETEESLSRPYEGLDTDCLEQLVHERGIPLPRNALLAAARRSLLVALLTAYDVGRAEVDSPRPRPIPPRRDELPTKLKVPNPMDRSLSKVLQKIRDAPGYMGCDIGGTLVKMVLALPASVAERYSIAPKFGTTGQVHEHLDLNIQVDGADFVLRFISGSTSNLEHAVQDLGSRRFHSMQSPDRFLPMQSPDSSRELGEEADHDCPPLSRLDSDWSSETFTTHSQPMRKMATAGGGACKYAPLFREALRVEMEPVKELEAMVAGLLTLSPPSTALLHRGMTTEMKGSSKALFNVDADGNIVEKEWPEPLFPFICVIMGSGVSIVQVNSADEHDFVRVAGTACGGGTFLGLARMLTSAETFEEALALAERGDASRTDKLVRDIYGEDGCASLGLPGNLTACNFGKLWGMRNEEILEEDLARSLLQMVTQQSTLLASACARHAGCVGRVFFVGGFVDEANWMSRLSIAGNFRNLNGCAYFLRHCDFLGALGSLKCALRASKKKPEDDTPTNSPATAPTRTP